MKIAVTLILLSGFSMLSLACTQVPSDENGYLRIINIERKTAKNAQEDSE
jgi:hypothetical protein